MNKDNHANGNHHDNDLCNESGLICFLLICFLLIRFLLICFLLICFLLICFLY